MVHRRIGDGEKKDVNSSNEPRGINPAEWVGIIGAVSGAVIAVIVSLYELGPSAPGVVLGLLLGGVMLAVNVILQTRINTMCLTAQRREEDVAAQGRVTALALQSITNVLAELAKRDALAQVLVNLTEESRSQIMGAAAATAATKVADAAVIAAKAVTDTAMAVAREVSDAKRV